VGQTATYWGLWEIRINEEEKKTLALKNGKFLSIRAPLGEHGWGLID
jgi:hypothetical protein